MDTAPDYESGDLQVRVLPTAQPAIERNLVDDPFGIWSRDENAPKEDEQHQSRKLYSEEPGENGEVNIQIFPSVVARQSAAVIAGQFIALIDAGFTRKEALKIVLESMTAVVIHPGDDDEDD